MPIPNLDDFTARLDANCRDYLGEAIAFAADGVTFANKRGHVNYRDMVKTFEVASAIEQDITVSVMKADVPVRPGANVRLRLVKFPGATFKPINPRSDESGTHWEFEVAKVS